MSPRFMLIYIELAVVVTLTLAAFAFPGIGAKELVRVELYFSRLARRRRLALLVVGGLAIAMRLAALPILPIPQPSVDDEFSYLLQADTYLHGRLTNPTPPMWTHLETFHVNMQPTYQSKYPPAQGMVLAAGKLLGGYPIVGVWLSMAAMCAAICWMLQEWISPEWAFAGALILAIRLSVFSYWGNSYWGGAVPATGGALLLGGLARLVKSPRVRDALLMGLGIAILANSRPYEGLLLCIPVGIFLLFWWLRKKSTEFFLVMRRAILPLALCVGITAVAMGYYNWRVTGNALRLPYEVNEATYSVAPLFIFQSPRPEPTYRSDALREFYLLFALPQYEQTRSLKGLVLSWYQRMEKIWLVLLGPALTLPLLLALFIKPTGAELEAVRLANAPVGVDERRIDCWARAGNVRASTLCGADDLRVDGYRAARDAAHAPLGMARQTCWGLSLSRNSAHLPPDAGFASSGAATSHRYRAGVAAHLVQQRFQRQAPSKRV